MPTAETPPIGKNPELGLKTLSFVGSRYKFINLVVYELHKRRLGRGRLGGWSEAGADARDGTSAGARLASAAGRAGSFQAVFFTAHWQLHQYRAAYFSYGCSTSCTTSSIHRTVIARCDVRRARALRRLALIKV